jgi:hypothetical protein
MLNATLKMNVVSATKKSLARQGFEIAYKKHL